MKIQIPARTIDIPDSLDDDDIVNAREYRMHRLVEETISAIHMVLDTGGDGSMEESDYLLSAVMLKLAESQHSRLSMKIMMEDAKRRMGIKT